MASLEAQVQSLANQLGLTNESISLLRQENAALRAQVDAQQQPVGNVAENGINEVNQQINELSQRISQSTVRKDATQIVQKMLKMYRASPFTTEVLNKPSPLDFVQPHFPMYDGSTCPGQHMARYIQSLALYSALEFDHLHCRLFPASLKDGALDWFFSLEPDSIKTFKQLTDSFASHYVH